MINSTFGGFMTARQGMYAAQHGLNLTGHNLTNSATTGYTRQRLDQVTLTTGGNYRYASQYNVNIGNGVLVTGTSQLRDPFLDLRYRNEMAHVGYENVKNDVLNDLADILDEVKNAAVSEDALSGGGIFNQLGDILEKLQQLSNEVGNKEFDSMVKTSCQQLTTLLNSYSARIKEVEENLAEDLNDVDVPRVNEILKSISDLNKSIMTSEVHGESALELKDQRNLLIDELSEYMKINVKYTPVPVSDTIVVDRLTISLVSSDPDQSNINLVDHQQYRQLNCEQDNFKNWNLTLTEMQTDPPQDVAVDPDIAATLETAQRAFDKAAAAADPYILAKKFMEAQDGLFREQNSYKQKSTAVTDANTEWENANNTWKTANEALITARKELNELRKNGADEAAINAKITEINGLATDLDTKAAERTNAKDALQEAEKELRAAEKTKKTAETAYNEALDNLPKDPTNAIMPGNPDTTVDLTNLETSDKLSDAYKEQYPGQDYKGLQDPQGGNDLKNLLTGEALVGGNTATQKYLDAKKALEEAQAAYNQSLKDSAALQDANGNPLVINDIFTDGKLRGTLEMLNQEGIYDADASNVRGIGYYQNVLDTFANTFANEMNKLNGDGTPLFTTTDGETEGITADNIRIAEDWVDNKYGITATTQTDAAGNLIEGANDNILRFVMLFDKDIEFSTAADDGELTLKDGVPVFLDDKGNVIEYTSLECDYGGAQSFKHSLGNDEPSFPDDWTGWPTDPAKYELTIGDPNAGNTTTPNELLAEKTVFTGTFEEMFTNIGNTLGLDIKGTSENLANYEMLASNISAEREGATGVSLDEEAMHIMQYMQSYNASARLMTALDEMLNTLISNTGVVGR